LSGVVFATEGVLVAFSLRNSMTMFRLAKRDTKEEKRAQTLWMLNLMDAKSISFLVKLHSNSV
jgi:hypothetical protein